MLHFEQFEIRKARWSAHKSLRVARSVPWEPDRDWDKTAAFLTRAVAELEPTPYLCEQFYDWQLE